MNNSFQILLEYYNFILTLQEEDAIITRDNGSIVVHQHGAATYLPTEITKMAYLPFDFSVGILTKEDMLDVIDLVKELTTNGKPIDYSGYGISPQNGGFGLWKLLPALQSKLLFNVKLISFRKGSVQFWLHLQANRRTKYLYNAVTNVKN